MAYRKHIPVQLTTTTGTSNWSSIGTYYNSKLPEIYKEMKLMAGQIGPYDRYPDGYYKDYLETQVKVDDYSDIEEI